MSDTAQSIGSSYRLLVRDFNEDGKVQRDEIYIETTGLALGSSECPKDKESVLSVLKAFGISSFEQAETYDPGKLSDYFRGMNWLMYSMNYVSSDDAESRESRMGDFKKYLAETRDSAAKIGLDGKVGDIVKNRFAAVYGEKVDLFIRRDIDGSFPSSPNRDDCLSAMHAVGKLCGKSKEEIEKDLSDPSKRKAIGEDLAKEYMESGLKTARQGHDIAFEEQKIRKVGDPALTESRIAKLHETREKAKAILDDPEKVNARIALAFLSAQDIIREPNKYDMSSEGLGCGFTGGCSYQHKIMDSEGKSVLTFVYDDVYGATSLIFDDVIISLEGKDRSEAMETLGAKLEEVMNSIHKERPIEG